MVWHLRVCTRKDTSIKLFLRGGGGCFDLECIIAQPQLKFYLYIYISKLVFWHINLHLVVQTLICDTFMQL